jgi:hypothetical protein
MSVCLHVYTRVHLWAAQIPPSLFGTFLFSLGLLSPPSIDILHLAGFHSPPLDESVSYQPLCGNGEAPEAQVVTARSSIKPPLIKLRPLGRGYQLVDPRCRHFRTDAARATRPGDQRVYEWNNF